MILPDTIDTERLDEFTDEELVAELVAAGRTESQAEYVVDVLRGRVEAILL